MTLFPKIFLVWGYRHQGIEVLISVQQFWYRLPLESIGYKLINDKIKVHVCFFDMVVMRPLHIEHQSHDQRSRESCMLPLAKAAR